MSISHIEDVLSSIEGLLVDDLSAAKEKLHMFAKQGVDKLHLVFDFDRTLTTKNPDSLGDVTTWSIISEHLPDEAKLTYEKLFRKYRGLELAGEMSEAMAIEWWSSILNLFVSSKLSLKEVELSFMEKANIRPGSTELFELLGSRNVPSVILSAGVRDIIEMWMERYRIDPQLILSTRLEIDDSSIVTGWDRSTLVHTLNKHEADHPELSVLRSQRPNTIVVGDSMDDANMALGAENVFRIRIIDQREDETDTDRDVERSFKHFDAVMTSGSMHAITSLIRVISDQPEIAPAR